MDVTLVEGPPCSGKTTYVREHMQPGDLVIDYDALAVALGSPDTHDHPETLWPFILQARDAVLDRMARSNTVTQAWIIRGDPTPSDRLIATHTVLLDEPAAVCKARATEAGRPGTWHRLIDDWYASRER